MHSGITLQQPSVCQGAASLWSWTHATLSCLEPAAQHSSCASTFQQSKDTWMLDATGVHLFTFSFMIIQSLIFIVDMSSDKQSAKNLTMQKLVPSRTHIMLSRSWGEKSCIRSACSIIYICCGGFQGIQSHSQWCLELISFETRAIMHPIPPTLRT